jgi:hypothetical protein
MPDAGRADRTSRDPILGINGTQYHRDSLTKAFASACSLRSRGALLFQPLRHRALGCHASVVRRDSVAHVIRKVAGFHRLGSWA